MSEEPQLDLAFARHPLAGTRLVRRRLRYPFVLTQAFRLDRHPADMLTAIVQSSSGALLGEDRLHQRIAVGPGAHAHVTTQAAMSVHRMGDGDMAEEHVSLEVAAGGWLEYLPSPRILFPDSALRQSLAINLAEGGIAIVADGFTSHDPGGGDRPFRAYRGEIVLQRPDGARLALDRFRLDGPPRQFGAAGGWRAHGLFIVARTAAAEDHAALAESIEAAIGRTADLRAGASPLPRGSGVAVRIAARDGSRLRSATTAAFAAVRLALTGHLPERSRTS